MCTDDRGRKNNFPKFPYKFSNKADTSFFAPKRVFIISSAQTLLANKLPL
jgi:hypothetical protein